MVRDQHELLDSIIARLDRGDARDNQWPDAKGEYWALCPYHADTHAANFSVSERGYRCFACGAKGGLRDLADKLGIPVAPVARLHGFPGGIATHTFTLADYATAKQLDPELLRTLGLEDVHYKGTVRLAMPYYDTDGNEVARRYRWSLTGKKRFTWARGSKLHPYGLWKLAEATTAGYVYLVEGESDAQTLGRTTWTGSRCTSGRSQTRAARRSSTRSPMRWTPFTSWNHPQGARMCRRRTS